ncbi:isopenicillin N synthase family dioxygenase [Rhodococcoides yunnanense]|jgi:isopenicillin N synthase-like dioxygenase|uniref:isopenicillin N synthase family dioxygenase n=1 Tax=Rhodococcoides yunnanense TaxID=278209 RepID=UPI0022B08600|nr:2-oxoglutarate and iron-dependent oxygenase domain-containing protein [Rhodococcus yunnanensis]MCZ4278931.1 isopenicillin N synthase family oxygenase [Rhodococcus yunnanensis]
MFTVPIIDMTPYVDPQSTPEQRAQVARALDEAAATVGFMQIVGHGVPTSAVDKLTDAVDEFFALPLDVKKRYISSRGENRGYSPPKSESLSMSLGVANANQMNDYFEAFTVGAGRSSYPAHPELPASSYPENFWPDDAAPAFQAGVQEWFCHARGVSRNLLRGFTDALQLAPGYFDNMVDYSIDIMNLNNYALPEGEVILTGELTGMGAHTDFGILTVLWADQVPGLQILDPDGMWQDVQPADGALIVNLGDAMARWTNDRWLSTIHRVDPPIADGRIIRRRSAAFFFDGNYDAVIETLPGCARTDRPGYHPITVADNINAKLAGLKAGIAPTAAAREALRLTSAKSAT